MRARRLENVSIYQIHLDLASVFILQDSVFIHHYTPIYEVEQLFNHTDWVLWDIKKPSISIHGLESEYLI